MTGLGIFLIVVAIGLIIGELFTGSGLLALGGLTSLIAGLVLLWQQGVLSISWWLVVIFSIVVIGLIVFIVLRIINIYRHQSITGKEEMVGKTAVVKDALDPEGTVFYQGEYWNATSVSGKVNSGEEVIIKEVNGLTLIVMKK
jgi:membrane-bound serine protease (ClpP class)